MRSERGFYVLTGAAALLLASLPYLYGWFKTPAGAVYSGFTTNVDDCLVYLSWMREAASGHALHRNLFSTEAQTPRLFYLWFWCLGMLGKGIGFVAAFHVGRVLGGAALLAAFAALLRATLVDEKVRRVGYALACFAGGFGWLFGGYDPGKGFVAQPIDLFQPEALTFATLGYSPLFAPMTALMALFVLSLWRASRSGRLADAAPACVAGAVLGNSHSYDVIPLFLVAAAWLGWETVAARRFALGRWLPLLVIGLASLPTTAYTAWASRVDPLFLARVWKNEPTLTPALWWVLLGYGLVFVYGLVALSRRDRAAFVDPSALRLLAAWAVVGVLVAYLPFPFQRKLLMGAHLPWCALAGVGLSSLAARLSGDYPRAALALGVVLAAPTHLLNLQADLTRLDANVGTTARRPYLSGGEAAALAWLAERTGPGDAVLVGPDPMSVRRFPGTFEPSLSCYVAGWAGRIVYNGHWSETLDYPRKLSDTLKFFRADADDGVRRALLREAGIRYVLYPRRLADGPLADAQGQPVLDPGTGQPQYVPVVWPTDLPPYLKPVFENAESIVCEVAV